MKRNEELARSFKSNQRWHKENFNGIRSTSSEFETQIDQYHLLYSEPDIDIPDSQFFFGWAGFLVGTIKKLKS